ncbi:helix-turn-helix domain-containing protein, partial [Methylobacterium sp. WL7]|uniref:helix-turn-helix domain-containing protein n=1 Tax=Methylobacterium sp. WL7 TaxID=2603900 RepID=UPI0011C7B7C6
AASPHVATRGRILSALYGDREAPDCADKLLNVMVYEIRKRLRAAGAEAGIRNIFGRGYVMTAATRDRLLDVPEEPVAPDPLWWAEAHRLRAEGASYRKIA